MHAYFSDGMIEFWIDDFPRRWPAQETSCTSRTHARTHSHLQRLFRKAVLFRYFERSSHGTHLSFLGLVSGKVFVERKKWTLPQQRARWQPPMPCRVFLFVSATAPPRILLVGV